MIDWPLVSVIIFLPLAGALIILFIKEDELTSINIKWAALLTTLGTFILSLILWLQFDYSNPSINMKKNLDGLMILISSTMLELTVSHFL